MLATVFAFLMLAGLFGNWLLDPFGRQLETSDRDDYGARTAPHAAPESTTGAAK